MSLSDPFNATLALLWSFVAIAVVVIVWPGGAGRRVARQIYALAVLGFREGIRQNVLWMMFALAAVAGALAFLSDADGTHAGRARLIVETCFSIGEILGATLIVLLSALSVSREIESRIMYTLGTKPVPRYGILIGKALGFWCVELVFALLLTVYTGALVRAVPMRPESRSASKFAESGDWELLRRNALITRTYKLPGGDGRASFVRIDPGKTHSFAFDIDRAALHGEALELKFQLASTMAFNPQIPDLLLRAGYAGQPPAFESTMTVTQNRPFSIFIDNAKMQDSGPLQVTLGASEKDKYKTAVLVHQQAGIRAGIAADGVVGNLAKSFLLLALQGWILAMITTGWSGVLSFPVTVALGLLLVMGGEMSRQALALLQATPAQEAAQAGATGGEHTARAITEVIAKLLNILPDFRTAGGPAAFIEGNFISGWALGHAAFWMGLVRGLGWAIPGAVSFHGREVGK
jgi:hypothetical protein